jgi:ankyrin repeat protein
MMASRNSNTDSSNETVKVLLEHDANTDLVDTDGLTALMMASRNSNTDSSSETVKVLLEHGADCNLVV